MPIAQSKTGDGFMPFKLEDAKPLAEIEFDIDFKRFLDLPTKDKASFIERVEPAPYGGWVGWGADDVEGVLTPTSTSGTCAKATRAFAKGALGSRRSQRGLQRAFPPCNGSSRPSLLGRSAREALRTSCDKVLHPA